MRPLSAIRPENTSPDSSWGVVDPAMPHALHTEIVIHAPAETVWRILTDFPAHPAWDPFFVEIKGDLRLEARLSVSFKGGMTFTPVVTALEPGRVLEWLGRLYVRGLFDGRHRFELVPTAEGTRLVHTEAFSGLLVPLLRGMLKKTERDFVAFNEALKRRAESGGA